MVERIELYKDRYLERLAICSEQKDIPMLFAIRTASEEIINMMKEDGILLKDRYRILCEVKKDENNS